MQDYRVNLDIYNGPLDLLLYLIRRDEVDVYDIPIARITEQYVQYVELLQDLNPNLAGDFLVLAATLIEIKSRLLLPQAPAEEGGPDELQTDPRAELVRQLLEYKAFKDAADDLRMAAAEQSQRFGRKPGNIELGEQELDLDDVQVWDLFDAFNNLMADIGKQDRQHEVIYDDTPIELHATDIRDRLGREGAMTFRRIFEGRTARAEIVGLFLALLELIKRRVVLAFQEENFAEICIELNPNPPADDEVQREAEAPLVDAPPEEDSDSTTADSAERPADTARPAEEAALPRQRNERDETDEADASAEGSYVPERSDVEDEGTDTASA